jgi:hypothetical protein
VLRLFDQKQRPSRVRGPACSLCCCACGSRRAKNVASRVCHCHVILSARLCASKQEARSLAQKDRRTTACSYVLLQFGDAIDFVLVLGWTKDAPAPTGTPLEKKDLKLLLVEHSSTQDLYTRDRRNQKRQKYVLLAAALQHEGWTVLLYSTTTEDFREWLKPGDDANLFEDGERPDPVHTIIVGHAGLISRPSLDAFEALGIVKVKPLLVALSKIAVRHLHYSLSAHVRNVLRRATAAASSGNASAPSAPHTHASVGVG